MNDDRTAAWVAAAAAMLMIAEHIAGKAVRDAFFLGTFGVAALPTMFIVAAVTSIVVVPALARALSAWGPGRLVTPAFAGSAILLAGCWWLAGVAPRVAAVAVYLHIAAINSVLISWFWSLVGERFDPRTARREMRRMVGGAALGGLVGGLIVERGAAMLGPGRMLLVLAGLHLACAVGTSRLRPRGRPTAAGEAHAASGFAVLRRSSYARNLAFLIVAGTICTALLDYVFKAQAVASFGRGPGLLRFFALFYAGTGLATFVVQTVLAHVALARLGIARTVATVPVAVVAGSVTALLVPGLPAFTLLRGSEMTLYSSLFRSGYELFFMPLAPGDKRAAKTLIDVGCDRLGDALGGGLLKLVLALAGASAVAALLGLSVALSLVAIVLISQLHGGYVRTLEKSLRDRVVQVDTDDIRDSTTMSVVMRSLADARPVAAAAPSPPAVAAPAPPSDPLLARIAALRSGDATRARHALAEGPLVPELIPHAIALLAWDETAAPAMAALAAVVGSALGQLVDALLAPDEEFTVRRRIPRVLERSDSPRVISGLLDGLGDARFEVRYRCGRALAHIQARGAAPPIDAERIQRAVLKEAALGRSVWDSQRLLDEDAEPGGQDAFIDDLLRDRASRSLAHVFTLLSLAYPGQPLVLAFRGLHTSDAHLRGTALEYLEGVLVPEVRAALWPYLEDSRPDARAARPRQQVLDELMLSNRSIQRNLEEWKKRVRI